jgi:outer membrane protein TolC
MRESARTGQKRAALRQAETNTDLVRDLAEAQVRSLLDEVEESRLRAQAQKKAVTQAQRGFDIASAQFREGIGSQLERTDAEVALRQSEFNYAQAVFDYLAARARLDEATGMVPLADDATRRGTL